MTHRAHGQPFARALEQGEPDQQVEVLRVVVVVVSIRCCVMTSSVVDRNIRLPRHPQASLLQDSIRLSWDDLAAKKVGIQFKPLYVIAFRQIFDHII